MCVRLHSNYTTRVAENTVRAVYCSHAPPWVKRTRFSAKSTSITKATAKHYNTTTHQHSSSGYNPQTQLSLPLQRSAFIKEKRHTLIGIKNKFINLFSGAFLPETLFGCLIRLSWNSIVTLSAVGDLAHMCSVYRVKDTNELFHFHDYYQKGRENPCS